MNRDVLNLQKKTLLNVVFDENYLLKILIIMDTKWQL